MDTTKAIACGVPRQRKGGRARPPCRSRHLSGSACFSAWRSRALTFAPPLRRRTVQKPCRRVKRAHLSSAPATHPPDSAEGRRVLRPGRLQWRAHVPQSTHCCLEATDRVRVPPEWGMAGSCRRPPQGDALLLSATSARRARTGGETVGSCRRPRRHRRRRETCRRRWDGRLLSASAALAFRERGGTVSFCRRSRPARRGGRLPSATSARPVGSWGDAAGRLLGGRSASVGDSGNLGPGGDPTGPVGDLCASGSC